MKDLTIVNYFYSTEPLSLAYLGFGLGRKVFCAAYLFFRKICDTMCGSQKDADRSIVCSSVADSEPGRCSCEELLASDGGESPCSGCQHIHKWLQLRRFPGTKDTRISK